MNVDIWQRCIDVLDKCIGYEIEMPEAVDVFNPKYYSAARKLVYAKRDITEEEISGIEKVVQQIIDSSC